MLKLLFIIGFALSSSILPISAKKGVSILFTSDDVQSAVDKLTSRDEYVYNSICDAENRELASFLYEYLIEKFPHMHFLVGIGNSRLDDGHPTSGLSLLKRDQSRVFEGGFKGTKQIEYYDGYYAHQMTSPFEYTLLVITFVTNLFQLYMLWLIIYKSNNKMRSFRFALSMLLMSEFFFSCSVGYVMDPDLLFPYDRGCIINGLARFLGKNGGKIAFSIVLFFGASVFSVQVYCLLFRYTAIQQRYLNLDKKFNRLKIRIIFLFIGLTISGTCAFIAYNSMVAPEDMLHTVLQRHAELSAVVNNDSVIILLGDNNLPGVVAFGIFVMGGFVFATTLSIGFSLSIFFTIRQNASCFTAKTYRMHMQLTLLLIIQFCLPIIFLVLPVLYGAASLMFIFNIPKVVGDCTMLLLSLYTMANSMVTLVFIAPYREYTLNLLRIRKTPPVEKPQIVAMKSTRIETRASQ